MENAVLTPMPEPMRVYVEECYCGHVESAHPGDGQCVLCIPGVNGCTHFQVRGWVATGVEGTK